MFKQRFCEHTFISDNLNNIYCTKCDAKFNYKTAFFDVKFVSLSTKKLRSYFCNHKFVSDHQISVVTCTKCEERHHYLPYNEQRINSYKLNKKIKKVNGNRKRNTQSFLLFKK